MALVSWLEGSCVSTYACVGYCGTSSITFVVFAFSLDGRVGSCVSNLGTLSNVWQGNFSLLRQVGMASSLTAPTNVMKVMGNTSSST